MNEIVKAENKHLEELGRLFNLYRIFYQEEDDLEKASKYISSRFNDGDSMIFVAEKGETKLAGFVQLYPSFCSVSAVPILILYDLFVDHSQRSKGIGRLLMNAARDFAKENGYARLELSTSKDNRIGQSLYESLGYELDQEFLHYSLNVD
ncbi:MAG: GNAT family N-acetyltransferase [Gammaproteobacteria bacterium]|jgi:ribosomal protein S18 acetylase RimI-like enzyme|nr:GNAT family N-acetyltransferase [Gammaproteobacteria bacterium]MDP6147067.1 GNAT family N-acetyltransferase [Gammaproteobacteria bacterium]HJL79579.1 GNAT family N-acetyltransferase [Gammaproteobacteria bacterium]HJN00422.1 GNAT family N-acetyltransferase [Gammaproteobacteria bacterium]|tara:strand:- start:5061 stop:5510 length:450 start_codon:yes stop_codon:yes gene_type:complete